MPPQQTPNLPSDAALEQLMQSGSAEQLTNAVFIQRDSVVRVYDNARRKHPLPLRSGSINRRAEFDIALYIAVTKPQTLEALACDMQ